MPYKCIVTGRSGYEHTKTDNNEKEKVQMHKFPTDESRRSVWINRIPRKLNKKDITKNSRICEKHFLLSDYVTERNDKQNRKLNRKGKILKKENWRRMLYRVCGLDCLHIWWEFRLSLEKQLAQAAKQGRRLLKRWRNESEIENEL